MIASQIINSRLIKSMKSIDHTISVQKNMMSYIDWLTEYRTFNFSLPRQTGKTTTLVDCMQQNTILLTYSSDMSYRIKTDFGLINVDISTVPAFNNYKNFRDIKDKIGSIFIDETQLIKKEDMVSLYETLYYLDSYELLTPDFFILGVGTPTQ